MAWVDIGAEAEAHTMRRFDVVSLKLQQDRRHHAEIVDHGRAGVLHDAPPAPRAEAVERHDGAALEDHAGYRAAERVVVKQRQRREYDFVLAHRGFAALVDIPVGETK